VIHHVVSGQGIAIVNKYHTPLKMDANLARSAGEFPPADAAMTPLHSL
jgi:hypothetical protein